MRKFRTRKDVNDYQVGNFIYHEEADRVKVSDVSVFNLPCTVYDVDLMMTVHQASVSCMERHKDIYGMKAEVTGESESEDLESVKEKAALDAELRAG